jgi:hypothetical protein
MFEFFLMVSFLFLLFIGYQQVYPYVRKYWGYKRERQELVIRYNRVWRSRKDMLVRHYYIHNHAYVNINFVRFILIGQYLEQTLLGTSKQ